MTDSTASSTPRGDRESHSSNDHTAPMPSEGCGLSGAPENAAFVGGTDDRSPFVSFLNYIQDIFYLYLAVPWRRVVDSFSFGQGVEKWRRLPFSSFRQRRRKGHRRDLLYATVPAVDNPHLWQGGPSR